MLKLINIRVYQGLAQHTITAYSLSADDVLTPVEERKCDYNNLIKEALGMCENYGTKVVRCNDANITQQLKQFGIIILEDNYGGNKQ